MTIILAVTNGILVFLLCLAGKGKITSRHKKKRRKIIEKFYSINSVELDATHNGDLISYQYYGISQITPTVKEIIDYYNLEIILWDSPYSSEHTDKKVIIGIRGAKDDIEKCASCFFSILTPKFHVAEKKKELL